MKNYFKYMIQIIYSFQFKQFKLVIDKTTKAEVILNKTISYI